MSDFASSRGKTIGLIIAGVVAVGALGGLAGLVFGGDDELRPPSGGGSGVVIAPGAGDEPDGGSILSPSPLGSAEPEPEAGESSEEPEPTAEPSIVPEGLDSSLDIDLGGEEIVTIGNDVQVPVLPGWQVLGQGDVDVLLGDGKNSFVYAVTGTVDPSTDASSVIAASVESILPQQTYTQFRQTDISPLESFGSVVSMAGMQYQATWTDQQASVPLQGLLICAVRQDGTAVIITAEHAPPEEFEQSVESWAPVVNGTLGLFGGV